MMKFNQVHMVAATVAALVVAAMEADGVTLQVDQVRQRYPWNGLVDIDYTIAYGVDEKFGDCDRIMPGDRLEFMLTDDVSGRVYHPKTFSVPVILTGGSHRATWNSVADGFAELVKNARFDASFVHLSPEYMIIDVSGGPSAEMYPVTFTSEIPDGGFNQSVYKGDRIVLLKVPASTFTAGSPTGEWNRDGTFEQLRQVTIASPFYIGIFEVTQAQYTNVMGSAVACANPGDFYPRDRVSYNDLRTSSDTFMSRLRAKCRMMRSDDAADACFTGFDLPTEMQWEYACRAGTTTPYNSGVMLSSVSEYAAELARVGRFNGNQSDGSGGSTSMSTTVGSYLPNAWGIYDMHGNVWEWTRTDSPIQGSAIHRGGCSAEGAQACRAACVSTDPKNYQSNYGGFRLCFMADR